MEQVAILNEKSSICPVMGMKNHKKIYNISSIFDNLSREILDE